MALNHSLLLQSTKISDESNLLYNIHQSIIDLESDPPEKEIHILLKQSILYLDEYFDQQTIDDLFILIFQCFSHISNKNNDFYKEIYSNYKKNSNRLIIFAMVFSEYDEKSSFDDLPNLINNILDQISQQIQTPKYTFKIYDNEINPKYVGNFIINILLMTELNENLISTFFPYIFMQNNLSDIKIRKLIQKVRNSKFESVLPEFILKDKRIYSNFQQDNWSVIIPKISKQTFLQLFPYLDEFYSDILYLNRTLALSILEKYIELNIDFKSDCKLNIKILKSFNEIMMTPSIFNYLSNYNVDFEEYSLFKYISIDSLEKILSESNNLKSYEKIVDYDFKDKNVEAFSDKKFWVHLFSVISSSKVKYSEKLLIKFVSLFERYIEPNKSYEIIESMIFNEFPTANNGNYFLCDLIKNFDFEYKNDFNINQEILFRKIIESKIFPLPSFWSLFTQDLAETFLQNNDAMSLYAFCFSKQIDEEHEFKNIKIEINPLKDSNLIFKLIKNKNLDLLTNMNEESLLFVISSFLYFKYPLYVTIKKLTIDTVIPFFAISFLCEDVPFYLIDSELTDLIMKAMRYLPKRNSPLSIESINSILLNSNYFEFHFYDILINQLIEGNYACDHLILIRKLFELSNRYYDDIQIKYLFDKNGINLFNYLIQNISIISCFDNIKFNIKILNLNKIISLSNNYKYAVNTINFINNYCTYSWPDNQFKILFEQLIDLATKKLKAEDFIILYECIEKNQLYKKLSFNNVSIDINTIIDKISIYKILINNDEWSFNFYFELLFKTLMKEKSIANDYFVIQLEKLSCEQSVNLRSSLFSQYIDNFLFQNTFKNIFSYHSESRKFIRKPHFQSITYPQSKTGLSIISKLLKIGNYQAFYFLFYIASTFPFLFISNPQKVFTAILQKLDSFSIICTIEDNSNEILKDDLKISLLAFELLVSLLYSVKILDAFLPWLFEKIFTFSPSQILSMTYILNTLYKTKKVKNVTLAISIKFNFPEIASKLLEIDVPKEIRNIYKENIFSILNKHYELLNKLNHNKKMIFVDEMACLENPFEIAFNNFSTIFPRKFESIEFPQINNYHITNFLDSIKYQVMFDVLILDDEYKDIVSKAMKLESNRFKKCSSFEIDDDFHDNYSLNIRFCAKQPNWIYKWLIKDKKFPCFVEHKKILRNVIKKINKFEKETDEQNNDVDWIDIDYYFLDQFCQNNLFNVIIKEIETNEINVYSLISPLIKNITENQVGLNCFLSVIIIYILEHKYDKIKIIKKIFDSFSKENFESVTNNLFDLALIPEYRTNSLFILYIASLLLKIDIIPSNIGHLIGFMLISDNQEIIEQSLKICEKIDFEYLKDIQKVLRKVIDNQINAKNTPSISTFKLIIHIIPTYAKDNIKISKKILNKTIQNYREGKNQDNEALDLIFFLLCKLSPERQDNQVIIPNDEIDFSQSFKNSWTQSGNLSILRKAPPNLVNEDPTFWNLYNEHRLFLNDIVTENEDLIEKLHFLEDYPELLILDKRLALFRKKMKNKINEDIQQVIRVNRSNILENSFDAFNSLSRHEWLYKIKVRFENESGVDMGGLTKEWFTLVTKELFNPNFALFVLCENKSYKPNQLSSINQDHIEYFNFAGKFIARAIIQGQCINAHFCRSFYRQILRHQIKLKDLDDLGSNVYNSMQHILKNDPEPLGLNFTTNIDEYGSCKTILLKENGDEIDVTNENKVEYATLYANYYLRKSIIDQVTAFCKGFNYLIPHDEIKMFSPDELDLIICGIPEIDVNDMRENTSYVEPYSENHPVVLLFFSAISKWDPENLAKFLLFLTGSSQVPVNGFKDYADAETPITIAPGGDRTRLCVAHTCFNTLDLPEYEDEDELNEKLMQSIQECEFGIS
ncbi:hypothetical protein M9Y10_039688 [Tritrichomonas musculus]|uniref:HECT-type E3 ubiquitin transferase n=1 Tax=Tritrichomonas musculus TaxID=1915356 RepID=A0ABR2GRP7_9EUKA